MDNKDLQYLNNVADESQYACKRCAQGAYMFHRTTSQGSEGMNSANREIRARTAVCPINATMLTVRRECERYTMQQASAWALRNELSPRGEQEYKEVFDGVNYRDFTINIVDRGGEGWECSVTRRLVGVTHRNTVIFPKEPTRGSYFGHCTCGLDKRDSVPCEHMAAVVVSSRIDVLSRYNVMPFWWTRAQWQAQFPRESVAVCHANMEVIMADYEPDDNNRYCPSWSAPNKAGRPPKGKRRLSAIEVAQGKKRSAPKKPLTRFCQICRGFSHRATDCWLQEKNKDLRPKSWKDKQATKLAAAVEEAMRVSADPLHIGPDNWQGGEGNGPDEGTAD
jgi:hypothetical protein